MKQSTTMTITMMAAIATLFLSTYGMAAYGQEGKKAVFDANGTTTIDGQNDQVMTNRELASGILGELMYGSDEITHVELYEDGSAIATVTGNHSGFTIHYNHSLTAEFGYTYADNGTVSHPEHGALKMVFEE